MEQPEISDNIINENLEEEFTIVPKNKNSTET